MNNNRDEYLVSIYCTEKGDTIMENNKIDVALDTYETVSDDINLSGLLVTLSMELDGEEYTDGELVDIVLDMCKLIQDDERHKIRKLLANYGIVEE